MFWCIAMQDCQDQLLLCVHTWWGKIVGVLVKPSSMWNQGGIEFGQMKDLLECLKNMKQIAESEQTQEPSNSQTQEPSNSQK